MPDNESVHLYCSFCQRPAAEVKKLVAGPGVYICNDCVSLCTDILASEELKETTEARLPMWESLTDEQILDHLPNIVNVQAQIDGNLREWVQHLRTRQVSWERIGASLSMSRQSAWERFKDA